MMILVTGATGNIAGYLIPTLREGGHAVRALIRDESKGGPLRDLGADVAIGDTETGKGLGEAITGVDTICLITGNGETGSQQMRNVIKAARDSGGPRIVKLSGYGVGRIMEQHEEVEEELAASGLRFTVVKPTFFMQNVMLAAGTIASDGMMYMPFGDGRIGMIDIRDVADVLSAVLTSEGHDGKSYVLTGPAAISFHEVAAGISNAIRQDVTYVDVPAEAARESILGMGMPEWTTDGFIEVFQGFKDGYGDLTTPNVEQLTGHPARSFEVFASDFAGVFGAN
jgi:uncharacterized protein YbjT (DUF2867 family)